MRFANSGPKPLGLGGRRRAGGGLLKDRPDPCGTTELQVLNPASLQAASEFMLSWPRSKLALGVLTLFGSTISLLVRRSRRRAGDSSPAKDTFLLEGELIWASSEVDPASLAACFRMDFLWKSGAPPALR